MNASFRPEAQEEYHDALRYYLAIGPSLADRFMAEIEKGISQIQERPFLRPVVGSKVRRHLVSRFSFGIYYACEENKLIIAAIIHQSRNPNRWKSRER